MKRLAVVMWMAACWTTAPPQTAALAAPLLAAVPGSAPASGPPTRVSAAGWSQVDTPGFTLLGDVPEARLRAIGARLEAFRATLEFLHPGSGTSPRETFVYVFGHPENGAAFTPERLSAGGHLGINAPYDAGNYVVIAAPDDDPPLGPLYHAYAHQFLDDGFSRLPLFIVEGLAEVYTRFRVVPEGTLIGLAASDHVDWVRKHPIRSLELEMTLDAKDLRTATPETRQSFVSDSWTLMHYLLTASGDRRAGVPRFLDEMQHGHGIEPSARTALGSDLDGLRDAMTQYAAGNRFLPLRAAGDTIRQDATSYTGRPMPRDEVLAALGDLIAQSGKARDADAETYLAESLRLNPRQVRAHAALGALRCSRDRLEDSVFEFEKAIALQPDAMSCYLYARTLLKMHAKETPMVETPDWLARARALLGQATTLRPGFAAPYVLLGSSHTRPDGNAAAGIAALEKARALLPARTDIAGNLVYLYLRAGDVTRARAMHERVLVPSGDVAAAQRAASAIATYVQTAEGKRLLARNKADEEAWKAKRTPKDEKAYGEYIQTLRETLPSVTDPARREAMLAAIRAYEHPPDIDGYRVVEIFNEAIDHANRRDYAGAIAMLEDLVKHDVGPDMTAQINSTLEQLRKDAARPQQPDQ